MQQQLGENPSGTADNSSNNRERPQWTNPCDFFVSCLGYAVGLGNIWRFPILCFKYGGGSFLVAYILMLFCAGLPLFFLEIALGQYAGVGPIKAFGRMAPILQGLGYAVVCVGVLLAFFYNVVVSWSLWYLTVSIMALMLPGYRLEWAYCDHDYNSPCCIDDFNSNAAYNASCHQKTSSVEEYWDRNVLAHLGHDWTNYGLPKPGNVAALFTSWFLILCCLVKGIKSSGRISYLTSFLPYVILLVLAARGMSLPGAYDGIRQYFQPQWNKLLSIEIWVDAAKQIIFSLGPACGCVITLSSYNHFNRNCHLDAIVIAISNSVTSVFSGSVVFAILGYMAHDSGKSVLDVVKAGPGLAFLAYPEVVTKLPSASFLAVLFFTMLISLALGSIFGALETFMTACEDQWPILRQYKAQVVLLTTATLAILGLSFTCPAGIHMFTLFNESAPSWNLLFFALLEVTSVAWIYGVDKFIDHLSAMVPSMSNFAKIYWKITWKYLTPTVLASLLIFDISNFGYIGFENYIYPLPIQFLGYAITGVSLIWIPIIAVIQRKRASNSDSSDWLLKPTTDWGRQYGTTTQQQQSNEQPNRAAGQEDHMLE